MGPTTRVARTRTWACTISAVLGLLAGVQAVPHPAAFAAAGLRGWPAPALAHRGSGRPLWSFRLRLRRPASPVRGVPDSGLRAAAVSLLCADEGEPPAPVPTRREVHRVLRSMVRDAAGGKAGHREAMEVVGIMTRAWLAHDSTTLHLLSQVWSHAARTRKLCMKDLEEAADALAEATPAIGAGSAASCLLEVCEVLAEQGDSSSRSVSARDALRLLERLQGVGASKAAAASPAARGVGGAGGTRGGAMGASLCDLYADALSLDVAHRPSAAAAASAAREGFSAALYRAVAGAPRCDAWNEKEKELSPRGSRTQAADGKEEEEEEEEEESVMWRVTGAGRGREKHTARNNSYTNGVSHSHSDSITDSDGDSDSTGGHNSDSITDSDISNGNSNSMQNGRKKRGRGRPNGAREPAARRRTQGRDRQAEVAQERLQRVLLHLSVMQAAGRDASAHEALFLCKLLAPAVLLPPPAAPPTAPSTMPSSYSGPPPTAASYKGLASLCSVCAHALPPMLARDGPGALSPPSRADFTAAAFPDNIAGVLHWGCLPAAVLDSRVGGWEQGGAVGNMSKGPECVLVTDASPIGWGAVLFAVARDGDQGAVQTRAHTAHGCWAEDEARADQATREALAISLALAALAPYMQQLGALHLTDSQPALDCLREVAGGGGGGTRRARGRSGTRDNAGLHAAASAAHECAARHAVCMVSAWVPGDWINKLGADALSRPKTM